LRRRGLRSSCDPYRLSAFDLDVLRKAFKKSVRDHNVTDAGWAEYAKLFIKQVTNGDPDTQL